MGSLTWSTYRGDLFLIEEIFSNDVVDGERKGFAIADAYLLDDTEAFTSAAFDGCHKVPGSYCRVSSGTNALRPGISLALNKLALSFRRSGTDGYTKLALNVSAAKHDQKKFSDFSTCMESNLDKLLK
jgi:hypothetical protein